MVIRMCKSFTVLTTNPAVPVQLIGNKGLNGRKFLKAGTEERDNLVSAILSFLFKNIP